MKITEVNPAPKIQEAGEILQQMYHKKNKVMDWPHDSKPTIRGLVDQLNDTFLSSLTKDLDTFLHYGQAWVDLNPNDIWADKTGLPAVDDILDDPIYFATKKNTVFEIVKIRPTMYAIYAKQGFNERNKFTPENNLVYEYVLKVLDGSKMPLTYLKYHLDADSHITFGQEGRHRAKVAEILGATTMPCVIIASSDNKDDLRDFSGKIFNQFD